MPQPVFQYCVLRYVSDVVRDEAINVGVLVRSIDGSHADLKFLGHAAIARRVGARLPRGMMTHLEASLKNCIASGASLGNAGPVADPDFFSRARSEFIGTIQMGEPHGTIAPSIADALKSAYERYVAAPRVESRSADQSHLAPHRLRAKLWSAFHKEKLLRHGLAKREYTVDGQHAKWTFDVGYRNGSLSLVNSLALNSAEGQTNLSRALVLKGMIEEVRKESDLKVKASAVVASPQSSNAGNFKEAKEILKDAKIEVFALSEIDQLTERARLELTH